MSTFDDILSFYSLNVYNTSIFGGCSDWQNFLTNSLPLKLATSKIIYIQILQLKTLHDTSNTSFVWNNNILSASKLVHGLINGTAVQFKTPTSHFWRSGTCGKWPMNLFIDIPKPKPRKISTNLHPISHTPCALKCDLLVLNGLTVFSVGFKTFDVAPTIIIKNTTSFSDAIGVNVSLTAPGSLTCSAFLSGSIVASVQQILKSPNAASTVVPNYPNTGNKTYIVVGGLQVFRN